MISSICLYITLVTIGVCLKWCMDNMTTAYEDSAFMLMWAMWWTKRRRKSVFMLRKHFTTAKELQHARNNVEEYERMLAYEKALAMIAEDYDAGDRARELAAKTISLY